LDKAAAWLAKQLAYEFRDEALLQRALTHRSASGTSNERLEFLGDSVLQMVVSEFLFGERPDASEGRLSRLRSSLVKDSTLASIAMELDLGQHLILGSGERKSGGHRRASILADSMEALFGAVYLDAGFEAARHVVFKAFGDRIDNLPRGQDLRDPKSRLQEYLQARKIAVPVYEMEQVSGEAHRQHFEYSCSIPALEQKTVGAGSSRRDAEQAAAMAMLDRLDEAG
jgi:ribonuclease-3